MACRGMFSAALWPLFCAGGVPILANASLCADVMNEVSWSNSSFPSSPLPLSCVVAAVLDDPPDRSCRHAQAFPEGYRPSAW